jgi:short-subunit dehydrogenase
MQIDGKVVLVTGANGGLGEAIATRLAKAGAKLVLHARRKDALEPIAEKLGAKMIIADLAKRDDVERLFAEAGDVDIAVLNAALPATGVFLDMEESFVDRALDVNLRVPLVQAHRFAKSMAARGGGHIVFISSISGKVVSLGGSMYSATKFGMRGFALALREELAPAGIGVSTIFPGFIRDKGMFKKTGVKLPAVVGTKTSDDVAEAVYRSIKKNVGEIDVAAIDQRFGAFLAALSPGLVASIQKNFGGHDVSKQMMAAQRDVR